MRADHSASKAEIVMTIQRTPDELFQFWRVRTGDARQVEWVAEIINERPGEMISWKSTEGSDVRHAGSIWFTPSPGGLGTEVKLAVEYEVGTFSEILAKLFRRSPEQQMREDLRQFKQWMEAGEIATTAGQPAAREKDKTLKYAEAK